MFKPFQMLHKASRFLRNYESRLFHKWNADFVKYSDEVLEALNNGTPVVALESSILSHGMPEIIREDVEREVDKAVRMNGAVPATICILDGIVHIGTKYSFTSSLPSYDWFIKASRRDIPSLISQKGYGGTTVASTIFLAHKAGIPIFATGGIGGVHRKGEISMDVSADLYELSRVPMTVVSAGIKSVLDIRRTLEYLETLGVCVANFGTIQDDFPAFYIPKSGFQVPCSVETCAEAAELIVARDELGVDSSLLIGVPIPESHQKQGYEAQAKIEEALEKMDFSVYSKEITPALLSKVAELSEFASVTANCALYYNNAKVASQIAVELQDLKKKRGSAGTASHRVMQAPAKSMDKKTVTSVERPVVIGGSVLDIHVKALEEVKMDGRTLNGQVESTAGGVARNLADCMTRLDLNPFFISVVGAQEHSQALLSKMVHMDISGIKTVPNSRTAVSTVVLDQYGECLYVIGDMGIHASITRDLIEEHKSVICKAPLVVMDGNIPLDTMSYILELSSENNIPILFEPTDLSIAHKPFVCSKLWKSAIAYSTPNINELRVMHNTILNKDVPLSSGTRGHLNEILEEVLHLGLPLLEGSFHTLIVTLGSHGVVVISNVKSTCPFPIGSTVLEKGKSWATFYPALSSSHVISVSGAGDCFASGMIGGMLRGLNPDACIEVGQKSAILSLASHYTVPETISADSVFNSHAEYQEKKPLRLR